MGSRRLHQHRPHAEVSAALGILKPGAAVLVGFPKLDALVNGHVDGAAVRGALGLDPGRRTALYAPTWSSASSLNMAGETIITSLADAGFNVIVKPHDFSSTSVRRYSGGIDWRARLRAIERPGRIVVAQHADSSPLMAASDVLVTDHSSIGFEFCLLDRPIIVIDAPDLPRVARIDPERIALLQSAACVVREPAAIGATAQDELAHAAERAPARAALGRASFSSRARRPTGPSPSPTICWMLSPRRMRAGERPTALGRSEPLMKFSILIATYNRAESSPTRCPASPGSSTGNHGR